MTTTEDRGRLYDEVVKELEADGLRLIESRYPFGTTRHWQEEEWGRYGRWVVLRRVGTTSGKRLRVRVWERGDRAMDGYSPVARRPDEPATLEDLLRVAQAIERELRQGHVSTRVRRALGL